MKAVIRITSLALLFIVLLSFLTSCKYIERKKYEQDYQYAFADFESRESRIENEETYIEMGKKLYEARKIDLALPYFLTDVGRTDHPPLDMKIIENNKNCLEECCTVYAYVRDYFDTYQEETKKMTQRQKELYVWDFKQALTHKQRSVLNMVENADEQRFVKDFFYLPIIYLLLEGHFSIDEITFRMYWDQMIISSRGNYEKTAFLRKVREKYNSSGAAEALSYLKDNADFEVPDFSDRDYLIILFQIRSTYDL